MRIHLSKELEHFVHSQVRLGRFGSADEVIAEALRQLKERSQQRASATLQSSEDAWERQLVESGLLASIPARHASAPSQRSPAIPVKGEPLSETIIRERR